MTAYRELKVIVMYISAMEDKKASTFFGPFLEILGMIDFFVFKMISEIQGNLFSTNSACLAHCVSADFNMGAGIAVEFKKRFGNVDLLLASKTPIGKCAVLKNNNGYIYYLVTKQYYYNKPTYNTLKSALLDMKRHVIENKVSSISMPRIGCGLDRLNWPDVKKLLMDIFSDISVKIDVYYL